MEGHRPSGGLARRRLVGSGDQPQRNSNVGDPDQNGQHRCARGLEWRVRHRERLEHLIPPERWKRLNRPVARRPGWTLALNALFIALLAGAAICKLYWVTTPELVAKYSERFYPAKAVQWIEANQPSGRMFNNYNWGGYLSWNLRAYPAFVDGRTDLYADKV